MTLPINRETLMRQVLLMTQEFHKHGQARWEFGSYDGARYDVDIKIEQDVTGISIYPVNDNTTLIDPPIWSMRFDASNDRHWDELHGAIYHIQTTLACDVHRGPHTLCCVLLQQSERENQVLREALALMLRSCGLLPREVQ